MQCCFKPVWSLDSPFLFHVSNVRSRFNSIHIFSAELFVSNRAATVFILPFPALSPSRVCNAINQTPSAAVLCGYDLPQFGHIAIWFGPTGSTNPNTIFSIINPKYGNESKNTPPCCCRHLSYEINISSTAYPPKASLWYSRFWLADHYHLSPVTRVAIS